MESERKTYAIVSDDHHLKNQMHQSVLMFKFFLNLTGENQTVHMPDKY